MYVVRPIVASDEQSLYEIACASGHGFTSLPTNEKQLSEKIKHSVASFQADVVTPDDEFYMMVLEETNTSKVIGTCGLVGAVGRRDAFYHYRVGTETFHSQEHQVHQEVQTLTLCHDYTGSSELCSLFLYPEYRQTMYGRLLSRSRFLFMAGHRARFGDRVIAEMRGVSDTTGFSPFYEWLQHHFLQLDFKRADYLSGMGQKTFIAELMPRHPLYVPLLPQAAQAVIGQVHQQTQPALKLLQAEGFNFQGYVDIFDGGPTVECATSMINSVDLSQRCAVEISAVESESIYLISNERCSGYRAVMVPATIKEDKHTMLMTPETAAALDVVSGDMVRVIKQ